VGARCVVARGTPHRIVDTFGLCIGDSRERGGDLIERETSVLVQRRLERSLRLDDDVVRLAGTRGRGAPELGLT